VPQFDHALIWPRSARRIHIRSILVGDNRDVNDELSDADLVEIEQRAAGALSVAPLPWSPWLETRDGTGGCSFVQFGGNPGEDNEMYFDVRLGARRLVSPDQQLDAIIDFVGNAADDVLRMLAEIRRLRQRV
jgi:hypothetical protein